jgi:YD repeat-containing protein
VGVLLLLLLARLPNPFPQTASRKNFRLNAERLAEPLAQLIRPLGETLQWSRARRTNATNETDIPKIPTSFALSRFFLKFYPDGLFEQWNYGTRNRLESSVDRAGRVTSYNYDVLGRLTLTTLPDKTTRGTVYDEPGRVKKTIDGIGNTTTYIYNTAGRRASVVNTMQEQTAFTYYGDGSVDTITDFKGRVTKHYYTARNQLRRVVSHRARLTYWRVLVLAPCRIPRVRS